MAKDKNSFVLYANYLDVVNTLTREQAGDLFKLILDYVNDLNPEEPNDQAIKVAWAVIKRQLKDDLKRYEDKRNQLRANANKKYEKETNGSNCMQMEANATKSTNLHYVNDNVNVNVNVNDNVNDIDNIDNNKEIDNVNKENSAYAHDYISIELTNNIKEVFPELMTEESFTIFVDTFKALLKKYTQKNIVISIRHAIDETLEKIPEIVNPLGYIRNAIAINCEQFKN